MPNQIVDGGGNQVLTGGADNTTYRNFLIRAPLNLGGTSGVTIDNCDIGNIGGNGLLPTGSAANLVVTNNYFHDITGTGVYSNGHATLIGVQVNRNRFKNVKEGVHLDFGQSGKSSNCQFNDNWFEDYSRYCIELQWIINGLQVMHNFCGNKLGGKLADGGPISLATGGAIGIPFDTHNVECAFNILLQDPTINNAYASLEIMGSGDYVHDNYMRGSAVGVIYVNTDLSGRTPWRIVSNTLVNVGKLFAHEPGGADFPPTDQSGNVFNPSAPVPAWTMGVWPGAPDPAPTPLPKPTVAHTIQTYTDGSISVDGVAAK